MKHRQSFWEILQLRMEQTLEEILELFLNGIDYTYMCADVKDPGERKPFDNTGRKESSLE